MTTIIDLIAPRHTGVKKVKIRNIIILARVISLEDDSAHNLASIPYYFLIYSLQLILIKYTVGIRLTIKITKNI